MRAFLIVVGAMAIMVALAVWSAKDAYPCIRLAGSFAVAGTCR